MKEFDTYLELFLYLCIFLLGYAVRASFATELPICPVFNKTYPCCMNNYNPIPCSCFDQDQDHDVDLRDFAIAQNNFYWR